MENSRSGHRPGRDELRRAYRRMEAETERIAAEYENIRAALCRGWLPQGAREALFAVYEGELHVREAACDRLRELADG